MQFSAHPHNVDARRCLSGCVKEEMAIKHCNTIPVCDPIKVYNLISICWKQVPARKVHGLGRDNVRTPSPRVYFTAFVTPSLYTLDASLDSKLSQ